jgi:hypothetical protein
MGAIVDDCLAPRELIIPQILAGAAYPKLSGAIFMSGAKIYFVAGGAAVEFT